MTYKEALIKTYEKIFQVRDLAIAMNKQITPELLKEIKEYIQNEVKSLGGEIEGLSVNLTQDTYEPETLERLKCSGLHKALHLNTHISISCNSMPIIPKVYVDINSSEGLEDITEIVKTPIPIDFNLYSPYIFQTDLSLLFITTSDKERKKIRTVLNRIIEKGFNLCSALKYVRMLMIKKWKMLINEYTTALELLDVLELQFKDTIYNLMKQALPREQVEYFYFHFSEILSFFYNPLGNELEGYIINQADSFNFYNSSKLQRIEMCKVRDIPLQLYYSLEKIGMFQDKLISLINTGLEETVNKKRFYDGLERMYSGTNTKDQPTRCIYRFLFREETCFNDRDIESLG